MKPVKYFRILLILLPFVGLVSCTDQTSNVKIRIGFSQAFSGHPFRNEMNHAMRLQASLNDNIELTIKEAKGDIEKQKDDLQQMIKNRFDAIIVSPIDPEMVVQEVEQAYNLGIPVIILDRKVATENYTSFIGADNLEVGKM